MMFRSCSLEKDVAQALKDGHWPDACAAELLAHVETCAGCADLVLVTQTFQRDRNESTRQIPSGSPGLVWWRAQLQRRAASAARVSRPITIAQIFAWIVTSLVGVILVASQYSRGIRWAGWFSKPLTGRASSAFSVLPALPESNSLLLILICGVGAIVLFSGIVYVASERQ